MDTRNYLKVGKSFLHLSRPANRKDIEFFAKHAGYCVPPGRMACAKQLAQAEIWAEDHNLTLNWDWDSEGCIGCDCGSKDCPCSAGTEHETLWCWIEDANGKTLASLGSICGADQHYRRVVEAELALEAAAEEN